MFEEYYPIVSILYLILFIIMVHRFYLITELDTTNILFIITCMILMCISMFITLEQITSIHIFSEKIREVCIYISIICLFILYISYIITWKKDINKIQNILEQSNKNPSDNDGDDSSDNDEMKNENSNNISLSETRNSTNNIFRPSISSRKNSNNE